MKDVTGKKSALNWVSRSGNFFLNTGKIIKLGIDSEDFLVKGLRIVM